MTDLISRLRNAPRFGDVNLNDEAADEIERLRTVLQRIAEFPRQRNDELSIEGARALARAALKETP